MRDYRSLFLFEGLAKAALIGVGGAGLYLAGVADLLGLVLIAAVALACVFAGFFDYANTDNAAEAADDVVFSPAQSVVIAISVIAAIIGFLWYALSR